MPETYDLIVRGGEVVNTPDAGGPRRWPPGWTPFDGMQAKGWPMATIIRGRVVMRDDEVVRPHLGEPVRFGETLIA